MSLSSDEVEESYITFQEGVKDDPIAAAHAAIDDLKQKTAGERIYPGEFLGLIFFDGLCLGELIMKEFSMEQELNMAFVGGAAADDMTFANTLVCANDNCSSDGLVAVILKMKIPFFYNHYNHFLPTDKSFTITRVETMQRIAWEINGEPAAEFYARQIGVDDVSKLTVKDFARNPFGLILGDSIYIRSPNHVVGGTGLMFFCYIEAGTKVFLLKRGDIIENAQDGVTGVSQFLSEIKGCLVFNCVQRYLELIETDKINAFNGVFNEFPMIGFNTFGEELFTHHNQTFTAVFFGNPPEEGMTDPYRAKRLFHYTDSKLKSLVFDIVSRSELLNITISYLKGSMEKETDGSAPADYEKIRNSLGAMIEQANISKQDIERMLVVYQNNVENTGEFVFKIVDDIRAQNRRLVEIREEAIMANRIKSSFLATMSHEIRTPMNAISGIAELLLRSNLSEEARVYVQDIKQAGNILISIINDILDFSKIEADKMEIVPVKYLLASFINDTVSIIRTRLKDKPIRFFTNIDSRIPYSLFGDEMRLRQILLNLLSNAAKFTEKGNISLTITMQEQSEKQVWLKFNVTDTGKGITPEDQEKLFGEFVQVDVRRDRNIEGTGLGLAISKRLCEIMGGSIAIESEFGKGSTFTVTIPQGINSSEPFASVDNAANKKVLVYERRLVYARSVCWSLENMGVPYKMVMTLDNFTDMLFSEKWDLVLSGYGFHDRIMQIMKKPAKNFPGGKKPQLALMVEWGTDIYMPNVRFVSLPVQSISIANILNGKEDIKESADNAAASDIINYVFPNAKVLIVDDIITNLKVAEGLLAPYLMNIDTCLTGTEAIELVKNNEYNIIFMDHMMSEMDGIEATMHIRKWEKELETANGNSYNSPRKQIPIIALTANAISGVREMFIEKGFNDFLAKPIDVSKLDDILNKWISKDKRKRGTGISLSGKSKSQFPEISGIDVQKGINMTGGTEDGYYLVLSIFIKNTPERVTIMQKALESDNIQEFVINVHAIKSASASIGATDISADAASLEAAGKEGDISYINDNFNNFTDRLLKLIEGIKNVLVKFKADEEQTASLYDDYLFSLLSELEEALKYKKAEQIENILDKISKQPLDSKTKDFIDKVSDDVLMVEFDNAIRKIKRFIDGR